MKKRNIELIVTTVLCLLPIIAGLILYDKLPNRVATHFDANGEANGYSSRAVAVFGLPAFMAAVNLFVHFALRTDPKKQNMSGALRTLSVWMAPVLSIFISAAVLTMAMGSKVNLVSFLPLLLGVVFIVIGNYLPKTKQAYTMGIRLPWTLASEENWNRTHRLAGFVWVIGGALIVLLTLLRVTIIWPLIAITAVLALVPTVYSFILYRRGI